jgi:DNA-binding MarR family transcriptional regulator
MKPTNHSGRPSTATAEKPLRITYLVGSMDRVLKLRLIETLAPHGVTLPQFTALSVLKARGHSSNAKLAERSLITPQAANEVIKVMVARGWVTRAADPCHGRIVVLQLTRAGAALVRQCEASIERLEAGMMNGIEPANAELLHASLRILLRNLRSFDQVTSDPIPAG